MCGYPVPERSGCILYTARFWPKTTHDSHVLSQLKHHFSHLVDLFGSDGWHRTKPQSQELLFKQLGLYSYTSPSPTPTITRVQGTALEWLTALFGDAWRESRVLDHEEAIATFNLTTSPGFPFSKTYTTKRDFLADPQMHNYLKSFWNYVQVHKPPYSFWISCPKEDMIPNTSNKVRQISAVAVTVQYAFARLFGYQNEALHSLKLFSGPKVGISVFSGEWNKLGHRLIIPGRRLICADMSHFDSTIAPYWLRFVSTLRKRFLPSESHLLVDKMYDEAMKAFLLMPDGSMWQTSQGQKSGSFNTTDDNTIVCTALIMSAILQQNWMLTYDKFISSCYLCIYGDDVTMSIDPSITFDLHRAEQFILQMGCIVKNGFRECDLDDVEFLNFRFQPYDLPIAGRTYRYYLPDHVRPLKSICHLGMMIPSNVETYCSSLENLHMLWLTKPHYREALERFARQFALDYFEIDNWLYKPRTLSALLQLYLGEDYNKVAWSRKVFQLFSPRDVGVPRMPINLNHAEYGQESQSHQSSEAC